MTDHAKSNVVGAIVGTVTALLLYGVYTLIPAQPALPPMAVIDGAPHLRGAHQQKPAGIDWSSIPAGRLRNPGAGVPREDSKKDGELQSRARGGECKSVDPERGNPSSSALAASPKGLTGTQVGTRRSPQREPVTADTKGQPRADEASRSLHDERQVMPHELPGNNGNAAHARSTQRVTQRDSTSRAWLACIEAIFENVERARETEARTAGVLALEISSCTPHAPRSASKEGVTDEHRNTNGDLVEGARTGRSDGVRTNIDAGALRDGKEDRPPDRRSSRAPTAARVDAASRESGGEPWTNVTDQPWTSRSLITSPTMSMARSSAEPARATAAISASLMTTSDCRPSADTDFTPSAATWIAKANAWADSIDAKYDRSISIYYNVLRCNGSIPFQWYMSTLDLDPRSPRFGAVISDQTPVEWMCAQHMDSPLAAMMVHTLPVMRPTFGGPYTSVLISYNDHDARIAVGEGTEYAGCGRTADKPCQFRAAFPCVWPMWRLYDDGKGGAVAVVSGWDVNVPGRIEVGPKGVQP